MRPILRSGGITGSVGGEFDQLILEPGSLLDEESGVGRKWGGEFGELREIGFACISFVDSHAT